MQLEFKETHQVSSSLAEECIKGARKELHIGSDNEAEQQHDAIMAEATKMLTEKGHSSRRGSNQTNHKT
jgi:hypothetical protein